MDSTTHVPETYLILEHEMQSLMHTSLYAFTFLAPLCLTLKIFLSIDERTFIRLRLGYIQQKLTKIVA